MQGARPGADESARCACCGCCETAEAACSRAILFHTTFVIFATIAVTLSPYARLHAADLHCQRWSAISNSSRTLCSHGGSTHSKRQRKCQRTNEQESTQRSRMSSERAD